MKEYYDKPNAMEPLHPDGEGYALLEKLATDLIEKSARLSGALNPITKKAIADFLRPMNSYYSNLIEGHDTHPIDIERALLNIFSEEKEKRDLQEEARAHIVLHKEIGIEIKDKQVINPFKTEYVKSLHKRFYDILPSSFKEVISINGTPKTVVPGELRKDEVIVGKHVGPAAAALESFMDRFESFYNPESNSNKNRIRRIISIAAAHHRLAWIHPFLDGNGRVVRLFSDACFMLEGLDSDGMWSISRGLAKKNNEYKDRLANADLTRRNDFDGRGNLSNRMLIDFCSFFLTVAIDQIDFMSQILEIEGMQGRIEKFVDLMVVKGELKTEARFILNEVFFKGKLSKQNAERITNTSDKTLKIIIDKLHQVNLIELGKEGKNVVYYAKYPVKYSAMLFPGMYPSDKEIAMML